jgi:hypothetical protein
MAFDHAGVSVGNYESPLTLSLSRERRGDRAAGYPFEYEHNACSEVVTLSLCGRGWPQSGRLRGD